MRSSRFPTIVSTVPWRTCAALTLALMLGLSMVSSYGQAAKMHNPIVAGDHPDPSIIRVGMTYWTASTSGDWSPQFPLYRSNDLKNWVSAGSIFPIQPGWAKGDFWAPELVYDHGRVLVYYVGRKRGGSLCVAVATAPNPAGPYTDHGPMVCQEDGSIDPAFARDEKGKPFLVWKEDGNSIRKPTILWAQPLTDTLTQLTDSPTQILVNEPASWEGGVVEAPYVLRHGGKFYLFYAGNGCCGIECNYAEGVARADHLLGPWVKDPANPIIRPNASWRCPGHGSAVTTQAGKDYFLYHAYPVEGTIYLGRESVLDRIDWNPDGWPSINGGKGPSTQTEFIPPSASLDAFVGSTLSSVWRWPVNGGSGASVLHGTLLLTTRPDGKEDVVARSLPTPEYAAEVDERASSGAMGSLAVVASAGHAIGLGRRGRHLELWREDDHGRTVLWQQDLKEPGSLRLKVTSSRGGKQLLFSYKNGPGSFQNAGDPIDISHLPQWDEGLRVGMVVNGLPNPDAGAGTTAEFQRFTLHPDADQHKH